MASTYGGPGRLGVARLRRAESRAITAENPSGARGGGGRATEGTGAKAARDLGTGWKVSPSRVVPAGETLEVAAIEGQGVIEHVWLTTRPDAWRSMVLRMSWDGEDRSPAVAVPLGDFFGQGWGEFAPLLSEPIVVAPYGGMNCYFPMPFRTSARISIENLGRDDQTVYYQVDYALGEIPDDAGYLHASWRRANPVPAGEVFTILDGARGRGRYVGTYMAIGVNSPGWWGEGEVKFFLDDEDDPTICGTGTEDYFGGAWDFEVPGQGYSTYSSSFLGLHQVIRPDGLYRSQTRFGMYRWHLPDPVPFTTSLRFLIEHKGWIQDHNGLADGFQERFDLWSSVAFWYQQGINQDLPEPPYGAARLPQGNATQIEVEENIKDVTTQDGEAIVQRDVFWSKDLLTLKAKGPGSSMNVPFDVAAAGYYEIVAQIAHAPDYGDYSVKLDGAPIAPRGQGRRERELRISAYGPELYVAADHLIGWTDLQKGRHILTLTCTGKNAAATGYNLGIDDVVLARISDNARITR